MQIETVKNRKEYLGFIHELYKNDPHFKDNKTGIIPIVSGKNSPFYKNSIQKMVAVKEDKRTLCQAIFIIHRRSKTEMSIAFFEALPNQLNAVNVLIKHAEEFGNLHGVKKLVFGLDGHCNNSVGFSLTARSFPSFGESFQKEYYHEYFKGFRSVKLVSYFDSTINVNEQVEKGLLLFKNRNSDIQYEYANFGIASFANTMKRYTDLNNQIFKNHRYYFIRSYSEDYDLFHSMRLLLKNENLIFAKKADEDIGFILWYPDFNQLVTKGNGVGVLTFLKYKLFKSYPYSAKVVEIGMIDKHRNSGIMHMLFATAIEAVNKYEKMSKIVSSWILDENNPSKNLTQRYTKKLYKEFIAYEKDI
ncbi:MAG: hypothetical protein ACYDEX_01195 [Mobilitalea sp.]